jgi:hypothetical protein
MNWLSATPRLGTLLAGETFRPKNFADHEHYISFLNANLAILNAEGKRVRSWTFMAMTL